MSSTPLDPAGEAPELSPMPGGWSGETFSTSYAGERAVVRIYGGRSLTRGPRAAESDAAVLHLVRGLLPVPDVLEVRVGQEGVPALLVTEHLPGERLDLLLPELATPDRVRLGATLGVLLARLAHVARSRAGFFTGPDLSTTPFSGSASHPAGWVEEHLAALELDEGRAGRLLERAEDAGALLALEPRACLVHGDLNPKNLLVDPGTLAVTGVLDWEFAHAGSPYADLGNLLRHEDERDPYVAAVLGAFDGFMPVPVTDVWDRARAADLVALVDLAARAGENPVADEARALLMRQLREGAEDHDSGGDR